MKWPTRATFANALCALALLTATSARGESARELTWENLVPPAATKLEAEAEILQDKLYALEDAELERLQLVAKELLVRDKLAASVPMEELNEEERQLLEDKPSEAYPDALAFWNEIKLVKAQIQKRQSAVDPKIDGERVRIPGYVLPLEFDGTEVREFLLVPYVGACIHTPPPPPNQMVFVEAHASFETEGLYSPVWVEGTISTTGATHDLSFVDGQAPVEAGYSMGAAKVEPYKD